MVSNVMALVSGVPAGWRLIQSLPVGARPVQVRVSGWSAMAP